MVVSPSTNNSTIANTKKNNNNENNKDTLNHGVVAYALTDKCTRKDEYGTKGRQQTSHSFTSLFYLWFDFVD